MHISLLLSYLCVSCKDGTIYHKQSAAMWHASDLAVYSCSMTIEFSAAQHLRNILFYLQDIREYEAYEEIKVFKLDAWNFCK